MGHRSSCSPTVPPRGGYPKIGTVIGADIPRLAQLMPGERLRFEAVDLAQAAEVLRAVRRAEEKARKV